MWWALAGGLGVCLFAVVIGVFHEALETLYLRETEGRLEQEFGFTSGHVPPSTEQSGGFTLTALDHNGVLAKAGVKTGDRPWDYHGRSELAFYFTLQAARSRVVVLRVLRSSPRGEARGMVEIPVTPAQK
jgi:hypothetical protein